jgi:isoleucyl-tRNA synthetase
MVSVPGADAWARLQPYLGIIRDELNIKEVVEAADLDQYIRYSAKLNFKIAGPKLGGNVKAAAAQVAALTGEQVRQFVASGKLTIESLGGLTLTAEDVDVVRAETGTIAVETDGPIAIGLVTDLTAI